MLLLSALSTTATRAEMHPLSESLRPHFTTVSVDWPGFGDAPRPPLPTAMELHQSVYRVLKRENHCKSRMDYASGN